MSKRLYYQFNTLVFLVGAIGMILFVSSVSFSAEAYPIPQTAEVRLAWDPNDPAPDGYRIYQRTEQQSYDYSQPCWTGSGTSGIVYNLEWDITNYYVVRAFVGVLESADPEEVSFVAPSPEPQTYRISADSVGHGSIAPGGAIIVAKDADETFTLKPDTGYHVAKVIVDGKMVGTPTTHVFSNVTNNHSIAVDFELDGFSLTATAGEGGSIFPAGLITVNRSASQTFSLMADDGYEIQDLVINGQSHGVQGSCTIHDIDTDYTNFLNSI